MAILHDASNDWKHSMGKHSLDSRLTTFLSISALATVCLAVNPAMAATPMVELKFGKTSIQGKVVAHDANHCWIMGQDGRIRKSDLNKQTTVRRVGSFQPWNSSIVREQVRRELGKSFEVAGTRHYLVFAHDGRKAKAYAEWFEDVYKTFHLYFSVRGVAVSEPEFPLVAIVFPDQPAFAKYAQQEKVKVSSQLQGYYLTTSNRVALFERGTRTTTLATPASLVDPHAAPLANTGIWGAIMPKSDQDLYDTIVHEGTHQVAFNTGLHSRLGADPKWVVEGLATVFEAPGIRNSGAQYGVATRINRERYQWFGNYLKNRRPPNSLEEFISNDDDFGKNTLDAYSQAWALSFFLIETRPQKYSQYLTKIAKRSPFEEYDADQKLADFQAVFGKDTRLLEAEFLRFIARLH